MLRVLISSVCIASIVVLGCSKGGDGSQDPDDGTSGGTGGDGGNDSSGGDSGGPSTTGGMGGESGEPHVCENGTYGEDPEDQDDCTPFTDCVPGEYVASEGSSEEDRTCSACSDGQYSAANNSSACVDFDECAPGFFVESIDEVTENPTCAPCPGGHYCAGEETEPVECEEGTWDGGNGASPCDAHMICSAGTYIALSGTTSSDTDCAPCAAGSYSENSGSSSCESCPVGHYCPEGAMAPAACEEGTWDQGDTSVPCAAHRTCAAGEYVTAEGDTTTDRTCSICDLGTFTSAANQSSCAAWTSCESGQIIDNHGTRERDHTCHSGWVVQFGTSGNDLAKDMKVDAAGNAIVVGDVGGDLQGTSAGGSDGFVRKVDGTGSTLWTVQLGDQYSDSVSAVAVDASGDLFITGHVSGDLDDGGAETHAGLKDIFVAKLAGDDGDILWLQQFGSTADDFAGDIALDGTNVAVSGWTEGDLLGATSGAADAVIFKLSATDGATLWSAQFGTAAEETASGVAFGAAGSVIIGGTTDGNLGGTNAGEGDHYLRKYASDGSTIAWTSQWGSVGDDEVRDVLTHPSGSIFVAGNVGDDLFDNHSGQDDVVVAKFSSEGVLVWGETVQTSSHDDCVRVYLDASGNLLLSGRSRGALEADGYVSNYDAFLIRLAEADGAISEIETWGTYDIDYGVAAAMDTAGDLFFYGITRGDLGGSNLGVADLFLLKRDL